MNPIPTPRIQDPQQSQFYLHDQPQVIPRRTWGRPPPAQNLANEMAAVGYQQPPPMDSRYSPQPQQGNHQKNSPQLPMDYSDRSSYRPMEFTSAYQQDPRLYQDTRTWGSHPPQQKGFVLHDTSQEQRYLNGGDHSLCNTQMHHPVANYPASSLFSQTPPTSASPQHRNTVSIRFECWFLFSLLTRLLLSPPSF